MRRDFHVGWRGNPARTLAPRAQANQQSADGGGVSTSCAVISTHSITAFVPGVLGLYVCGRIFSRDGTLSSWGCCGASTLSRGETLPAWWFCESEQTSEQLTGGGLHTVQGGIDPGDHCFRPRVAMSSRCMERCPIPGGDFIVTECGGTLTLAERATLAARWCEPQAISDQSMGWEFQTVRGGMDPGDHCLRHRVDGFADRWRGF